MGLKWGKEAKKTWHRPLGPGRPDKSRGRKKKFWREKKN